MTERKFRKRSIADRRAQFDRPDPDEAQPERKPTGQANRARSQSEYGDRQRIGIYWNPGTFDQSRRAFWQDVHTDSSSPDSFTRWVEAQILRYAGLTATERERERKQLDPEPPAQRGIKRNVALLPSTRELIEQAVRDDYAETGKALTRSTIIGEAVRNAAVRTKRRLELDELPPAPDRIPLHIVR